jgi:Spy/CpxP family protein refolding chaperone
MEFSGAAMRMARIAAMLVVALLAGVPESGAQSFKWWQDEKSKAVFGLSVDQVTRLEEIFQTSLQKMRPHYDELSKQERALSALIEKPEATESEVARLAEQVERLRAELGLARTLMLFRLDRVLTPDQRAKLKDFHESRGRSRGPGERR